MSKWDTDAKIMKLRGLGYNHEEIADKLNITQGIVQYQLEKINERAQEEGDDLVFSEFVTKIYLPKILRLLC